MDLQLPSYLIGTACLLLAGILMTASIPRRGSDLQLWIGALVFIAGADFAAVQRITLGNPGAEVIAAFAVSLGLALAHLALRHALGERAIDGLFLAPILVAAGTALAFANDLIARVSLLGLLYSIQCAYIFLFLISAGRQRPNGAALRMLAIGFAAICALLISGVTLVLYRPGELLSSVQERPAQSVAVAFAVAGIVVCSLAFLGLRRDKYEDRMTDFATRDELTGILNRRMFMEMGAHALSSAMRGRRAVSVLMLDLDHFKTVNDRHGHAAGDRLLKEVAETITGCLRECDILGRYGGEEFCVVLPDTASTAAMLIASRIRNSIGGRDYSLGKATCRITGSIGIASASGDPAQTLAGLIEQADTAMYRAKRGGRNRLEAASGPAPLSSAAGS